MGLFAGKCTSTARLDNKTAVITGCNTGIGKVTVKDFYQRGAKVIMACRNLEKANEALEDIKKQCESEQNVGSISLVKLDLTSLRSVRQCAQDLLENEGRIDLLVNNAGVMVCPNSKTEDGFEMQFGTNHLGHFLLTLLLLPRIIKSAPSRIINVSSTAHTRGTMDFNDLNYDHKEYSAIAAYGQSKLANILFTKELARRLTDAAIDKVTTYSLHPGVIRTELGRHLDDTYFRGARFLFSLFRPFLKSPEQGAQTTINCAVDLSLAQETGLYYSDCKVAESSTASKNMDDAKRLWDESVKLVGLEENYNPFKAH